MRDNFQLEHYREGTSLIVKIIGNVTTINAASFQSELDEIVNLSEKAVMLDGEKLEYISSAGLRVLLKIAKDISEQNKSLGIFSLNKSVQNVFEVSGFNKIIATYTDKQEALEAIQSF